MPYEEIILRLLIAVLAGGSIGYEREYKNRPAGFRTHILVCVGACIISLVQVNMNEEIIDRVLSQPGLRDILRADYGRLPAQVVSGIGFLGAGTIIHTKGSIKGLTTAATLWVVATLGIAIGYGYYVISLTALVICVLVLISLKSVQKKMFHRESDVHLEIDFEKRGKAAEFIDEYFRQNDIEIKDIRFRAGKKEGYRSGEYIINIPKSSSVQKIIRDLAVHDSITEITQEENEQ